MRRGVETVEREWCRGRVVKVAGEGGKTSTDLAQVQTWRKAASFLRTLTRWGVLETSADDLG